MEEGEGVKLSVHIKKQVSSFLLEVDFDIENEAFAVLGESGCGKSMTLKCIAGIETPDEGYIAIDDRIVFDSKQKINTTIQQRNIGFVFQNYALFPNMNVKQNISCGIKDKRQREAIVKEMIQTYGLEECQTSYPSHLSGGQQQRTAFARAMACKPEILLLDEPFSALDKAMKQTMLNELLQALTTYNGLIIYVSHDNEEVVQIANQIAILHQGMIVERGNKQQLFQNPSTYAGAKQTGIENISRISRINASYIYAMDWGIYMHTDAIVANDHTHIGISSTSIIGSDEPIENAIAFKHVREIYRIHQCDMLIQPIQDVATIPLVCKKREAQQSFVVLPKEDLILLK